MNVKQIGLSLVLLDFAGLSAYAVYRYGYVGVFEQLLANVATATLFVDAVIALSLITLWMWGDARERGLSLLPYLLLTLTFGSVGPLLYLIRREATPAPGTARMTARVA